MTRNQSDPRRANAEDRSEDQLSAGSSPPIIAPLTPQAKRFKQAEDEGIAVTSRWINHPAVREITDSWRVPVHNILAPAFGRILADTGEAVLFAWAIFGISGINANFEPTNSDWRRVYLTFAEVQQAPLAKRDFLKIVSKAAGDIRAAGAAIDPGWDGDLAVVATLMLAAEDEIPWELPPMQLAEWVYPPSSSAITPDIRGISNRRGVPQAGKRNIIAIQHAYEKHLFGDPDRAPYAQGGERAESRQNREKAARLKALTEVRALYLDASATEILQTWGSSKECPGSLYRHLIAREMGLDWRAAGNLKPALRTLQRDCADLGIPANP
jgi:hypothetical protein